MEKIKGKGTGTSQIQYRYGIMSMLLIGGILAIVFGIGNRLPGQTFSHIYGDYYSQYLYLVRHFWDALLHGESICFSFSWGMGLPTLAAYAGLVFSPFTVFLYFIPEPETAAFAVLCSKMMVSGFAFWFFSIRMLKAGEKDAVIFSILYSLSAFSLVFYVNFHHMDGLYILPLLICALDRYVRENKSGALVLLYAYSFCNSLYNGFVIGIFSFIVFMIMLSRYSVRGAVLLRKMAQYVCGVFIAVLLSMIVILPTITFMMDHMAGGSSFTRNHMLSVVYYPLTMLIGKSTKSIFNTYPIIYCGWMPVLLMVLFFADKRNKKKDKIYAAILLAFLFVCMFWKPLFYIMHIFHEPDSFAWRFSFLYIFTVAALAMQEFVVLKEQSSCKKNLLVAGAIAGVELVAFVICILKGEEWVAVPIFLFNLILLFVYAVLLSKGKRWIPVFCVIELIIASHFYMPVFPDEPDYKQESHNTDWERMAKVSEAIRNDSADPFYRVSVLEPHITDAALDYGFHGVNFFSAFDNTALWQLLHRLGYSARSQFIKENDVTEWMDMIFDIAYTVNGIDIEDSVGNVIERNELVLPLAFAVSEQILAYSAVEDPFTNQERLAQAMTGQDVRLFIPVETQYRAGNGVEKVSGGEDENWDLKVIGDEKYAVWDAHRDSGKKLYFYFLQDKLKTGLNESNYVFGGDPLTGLSRTGEMFTVPCIVPMKEADPGTYSVTLLLNGEKDSETVWPAIYCEELMEDALTTVYEDLQPGGIRISSFSDTRIEGTVTADADHPVLFTSIPYDRGWHMEVDHKEVEVFPVLDGAFMAAMIPDGEHNVIFYYKDDAALMGAECSLAGLLLLCWTIWQGKKKRKDDQLSGGTDTLGSELPDQMNAQQQEADQ